MLLPRKHLIDAPQELCKPTTPPPDIAIPYVTTGNRTSHAKAASDAKAASGAYQLPLSAVTTRTHTAVTMMPQIKGVSGQIIF
eukprot:3907316-Rhodomonas_salina.2